jgi:hypothetical protein
MVKGGSQSSLVTELLVTVTELVEGAAAAAGMLCPTPTFASFDRHAGRGVRRGGRTVVVDAALAGLAGLAIGNDWTGTGSYSTPAPGIG